ncbi:hypothetical protein [Reyranella sp.]|uniref:hypothetical protein n=1 Tax=Reyranella sp. TaxID=1929291 RepID=UPI003C7B94E8
MSGFAIGGIRDAARRERLPASYVWRAGGHAMLGAIVVMIIFAGSQWRGQRRARGL